MGNPVALSLTPGQASDLGQAEPLLEEIEPQAFLADKAYDADALIETLEERGITAVIPPKANRTIKRKNDFALPNAISSSVSSINSKHFAQLPLAMINSQILFLLLYSSLPLSFGSTDDTL